MISALLAELVQQTSCCTNINDYSSPVQVEPTLKDGLYSDWEALEGVWDHAFK